MKKIKIFPVLVSIFLFGLLFFSLFFLLKKDLPEQLRSLGYEVKIKDATFQGYDTKDILATKENENIFLQIIKNVELEATDQLLKRLESSVEDAQKDLIIFDLYTGKEQKLIVPDWLKPEKGEIDIKGRAVTYYLVYANEIFSLRFFSEKEAKYRGLFSVYYCNKKREIHRLEIYNSTEIFDGERVISLFSSLFCE